jgi:hypothetical protein
MKTEKPTKQPEREIIMDEIPEVVMPKIDVTKYIGQKAQIVSAKVISTQYGRAIKLETEIIAKEGNSEKPIDIKATKLLGLQQDAEGTWGISKDSKAKEFFTKYKVSNHKQMIGKTVIIQATEPKNGTEFLTFN